MTACVSLLAATCGCLGIAFCDANNNILLAISLILVGLGSSVQLCLQPVTGLFSFQYQVSILASLSGAFQVSGLMFFALTSISTDRRLGFGMFGVILLGLLLCAVYLLPQRHFIFKAVSTTNNDSMSSGINASNNSISFKSIESDYIEEQQSLKSISSDNHGEKNRSN